MKIQKWYRSVVVGGIAAVVLVTCGQPEQQDVAVPPAHVSVITLVPGTLEVVEDLPGRVAAVRTAEIRPQVSGIVLRRLFEQGTEITAGRALFQINPAPFKAEVDVAAATLLRTQAALARARLQFERLEPLMQADAVSRQVFDDAMSQRDQAAADVAQAQATLGRRQLDLKFATVQAPISGRIDQTLVTEGALVSTNDTSSMARIQQIDHVYVDLRQSSASMESLRAALIRPPNNQGNDPYASAQILHSDGSPTGLSGNVLFSGVNVDVGTGDVLLRLLVDNPRRQLLPGMYVQARLVRARYAQALTVPQQAVVRVGGKARVWVVDKQMHVRSVPVELGELVNRRYRVTAGVSEGLQVVVEGADRLIEGAPVTPSVWSLSAKTSQS